MRRMRMRLRTRRARRIPARLRRLIRPLRRRVQPELRVLARRALQPRREVRRLPRVSEPELADPDVRLLTDPAALTRQS
jgi:hypothetical protein